MDERVKVCMIIYNVILIVGIIFRRQFDNTLITSYFSILAILVIYMTIQNPDLYRERKTYLFNLAAADKITKELLFRRLPFHCVTLNVQKYESLKTLYGNSQMMKSVTRMGEWIIESFPEYYIFYFGNGEFMMLQKEAMADRRSEILEKLYKHFEFPWKCEETDIAMDMSVIAVPWDYMKDRGERLVDLIRYAYNNAYVMNKQGIVFFNDEMQEDMERKEAVERAVGLALEEERIEIYLQPIYSVWENRIVGAEALARLNDPDLGFIPPDEFIRIAEQTGDIMELGRQIFDKVCQFIEENDIRQYGIERINVNLSPAQCMNAQLAGILAETAEKHSVPFSMIDFEITETFVEDRSIMHNMMVYMQKMGAEFSLDDFGAGTSNIARLMQLPIHIVKLDINVVWAYFDGESDILPDLVRMFQNADLEIIAEGIETEEMKQSLADMGCDFEQGYYFSRPMPAEQFIEYIKGFVA
jgi:EAL domain-containing protein (putative c-di-GMP-specific phosphodiesterase class I)